MVRFALNLYFSFSCAYWDQHNKLKHESAKSTIIKTAETLSYTFIRWETQSCRYKQSCFIL